MSVVVIDLMFETSQQVNLKVIKESDVILTFSKLHLSDNVQKYIVYGLILIGSMSDFWQN